MQPRKRLTKQMRELMFRETGTRLSPLSGTGCRGPAAFRRHKPLSNPLEDYDLEAQEETPTARDQFDVDDSDKEVQSENTPQRQQRADRGGFLGQLPVYRAPAGARRSSRIAAKSYHVEEERDSSSNDKEDDDGKASEVSDEETPRHVPGDNPAKRRRVRSRRK